MKKSIFKFNEKIKIKPNLQIKNGILCSVNHPVSLMSSICSTSFETDQKNNNQIILQDNKIERLTFQYYLMRKAPKTDYLLIIKRLGVKIGWGDDYSNYCHEYIVQSYDAMLKLLVPQSYYKFRNGTKIRGVFKLYHDQINQQLYLFSQHVELAEDVHLQNEMNAEFNDFLTNSLLPKELFDLEPKLGILQDSVIDNELEFTESNQQLVSNLQLIQLKSTNETVKMSKGNRVEDGIIEL